MAKLSNSPWLLTVAGAAVALALVVAGYMVYPGSAQFEQIGNTFEAEVREASAAVDARAVTLAQLPRLGWAVATDEQTVLDLTTDELAFKPAPGESIEIGQVLKDNDRVVKLLHLGPNEVTHLPLAKNGRHLLVSAEKLLAAAVVPVQPRQRTRELTGAVAVSRPVSIARVVDRLDRVGVGALVETPSGTLVLGAAAVGSRLKPVTLFLSGEVAQKAKITLLLPPADRYGLWFWLLAVLVLGGSVVGSLLLRRRENAPLPALVPEVYESRDDSR